MLSSKMSVKTVIQWVAAEMDHQSAVCSQKPNGHVSELCLYVEQEILSPFPHWPKSCVRFLMEKNRTLLISSFKERKQFLLKLSLKDGWYIDQNALCSWIKNWPKISAQCRHITVVTDLAPEGCLRKKRYIYIFFKCRLVN